MTALQLGMSGRQSLLWLFIAFAAFMEFVYCTVSIWFIELLVSNTAWVQTLKWMGVAVFTILGLLAIVFPPVGKSGASAGFKRGMFALIVNPLQIPFWLIWGTYILSGNMLEHTVYAIGAFGVFTAIGSAAILAIYGISGKYMVAQFNVNRLLISRMVGILLLALAAYQLAELLTA